MKRFWKVAEAVAVNSAYEIRLDGKPVRTPGRLPLTMPNAALAEAIAEEWRAVDETIDPRAMRLTGLANAAVERIAREPGPFAAGLAIFGESDLLCYRSEGPAGLVARETAAWDPLLDWARQRYDVHFEIVTGVMHRPQPPQTLSRLAGAIAARTPFELAALAPIVTVTGSLVLALALYEGAAEAEVVWTASQVDDDWQAEYWGEDAEAVAARAGHRREYDAGVRFLTLLPPNSSPAEGG